MSRASHFRLAGFVCVSLFAMLALHGVSAGEKGAAPVQYCRFEVGQLVSYGIVEGEKVRVVSGDIFGEFKPTQQTFSLKDVRLLPPTRPSQVIALAGNYRSHINDGSSVTTITTVTTLTSAKSGEIKSDSKTTTEMVAAGQLPEKFKIPQPFFKSPSCLVGHGANIVLPKDSKSVHYEAELVIVIGKEAKSVPKEKALEYVFGVTCGNDVSERVWQKADVQWWRAKGSDTFGPVGPVIATGLNYDDLELTLRLNGEVKQKERTSYFIQDVSSTVSFISRYVTLHPGDLIFTGTPGKTSDMKPGDVVEVELEGVGILRNPVVAEE